MDQRQCIYTAFQAFVAELGGCAGIEIDQDGSGVVPGDEFTWQDVQLTDEWNFANLSHRET